MILSRSDVAKLLLSCCGCKLVQTGQQTDQNWARYGHLSARTELARNDHLILEERQSCFFEVTFAVQVTSQSLEER